MAKATAQLQQQSSFTTWPRLGHGPSFCFSCHRSHEKFGSKYSPGPCSFDILCYDAVSGFNKSAKTSSWMQEFPSTQRGLAAHRRHSLLAWAAALRSSTKMNVFGAQLSVRSRLAWLSYCSRGKDQHWFLSWKNVRHDAWVPGVSSWSGREEETLTFHWGCWGSLLQISGSRRASCEGKVGPAIINWW